MGAPTEAVPIGARHPRDYAPGVLPRSPDTTRRDRPKSPPMDDENTLKLGVDLDWRPPTPRPFFTPVTRCRKHATRETCARRPRRRVQVTRVSPPPYATRPHHLLPATSHRALHLFSPGTTRDRTRCLGTAVVCMHPRMHMSMAMDCAWPVCARDHTELRRHRFARRRFRAQPGATRRPQLRHSRLAPRHARPHGAPADLRTKRHPHRLASSIRDGSAVGRLSLG